MAQRNEKDAFHLGQQAMLDTVVHQLRLIHELKRPEPPVAACDHQHPNLSPRRDPQLEERVHDFLYDLTRSSMEAYRNWLDVNFRHFDTLADSVRASLGLSPSLPGAVALRAAGTVGDTIESNEVFLRNPLPEPLRISLANPAFRSAGLAGLRSGDSFTNVWFRVRRSTGEQAELAPGQVIELGPNEDLGLQIRVVAAAALGTGTLTGSGHILAAGRAVGTLSVTLEIRP